MTAYDFAWACPTRVLDRSKSGWNRFGAGQDPELLEAGLNRAEALEYTLFLRIEMRSGADSRLSDLHIPSSKIRFHPWEAFCDPSSSTIEGAIQRAKLAASLMI